jgi:hypothetical protein
MTEKTLADFMDLVVKPIEELDELAKNGKLDGAQTALHHAQKVLDGTRPLSYIKKGEWKEQEALDFVKVHSELATTRGRWKRDRGQIYVYRLENEADALLRIRLLNEAYKTPAWEYLRRKILGYSNEDIALCLVPHPDDPWFRRCVYQDTIQFAESLKLISKTDGLRRRLIFRLRQADQRSRDRERRLAENVEATGRIDAGPDDEMRMAETIDVTNIIRMPGCPETIAQPKSRKLKVVASKRILAASEEEFFDFVESRMDACERYLDAELSKLTRDLLSAARVRSEEGRSLSEDERGEWLERLRSMDDLVFVLKFFSKISKKLPAATRKALASVVSSSSSERHAWVRMRVESGAPPKDVDSLLRLLRG